MGVSSQHLIVMETEGIPPEWAHIYAVPHDPEDDWRFYLLAKFQVSVSTCQVPFETHDVMIQQINLFIDNLILIRLHMDNLQTWELVGGHIDGLMIL